jgi:putative DNA methylase
MLVHGRAISPDWIKAKAQSGQMGSALYAVALKTPQDLSFGQQNNAISTLSQLQNSN